MQRLPGRQTSAVPAPHAGRRLIEYLCERFPYLDRAAWLERIAAGRVLVGDDPAGPDRVLARGELVSYLQPDHRDPPADLGWSLVGESGGVLAVAKPGNLPVHRVGPYLVNNLVYLVRNAGRPDWAAADPIHRLDRDTSGLVLFALDKATLADYQALFRGRDLIKEYLAVVEAPADFPPAGAVGRVDLAIGPDPASGHGSRQAAGVAGAKEAATLWGVLGPVGGGRAALLVRPLSGRTHQIRVHLASLGWPIAGDRLYGAPEGGGLPRQALHCWRLAGIQPSDGRPFDWTAPPPADFPGLGSLAGDAERLAGIRAAWAVWAAP